MSTTFKELAHSLTPMGELSLRRRRLPSQDEDVFEIRLGEEFLMSSQFTAGEVALAELALKAVAHPEIDVVVGGLGLGFTARAALRDERVRSLLIVEALDEVIEWHRTGLIPLGEAITGDSRCRLLHGDFFSIFGVPRDALYPQLPKSKFHAILIDIDHSPRRLLAAGHGGFYGAPGLGALASHLHSGGVFALWSDDPPDNCFLSILQGVFESAETHLVTFDTSQQDRKASSTIYIARARADLPQTHRSPS